MPPRSAPPPPDPTDPTLRPDAAPASWSTAGITRDAGPPTVEVATKPVKSADVVVVGMTDDDGPRVAVPSALPGKVVEAVEAAARQVRFRGRAREVTRLPAPDGLDADLVLLLGLGKRTADSAPASVSLRRAAGAALRSLAGTRGVARAALVLPADDAESVRAAVEGALLGTYEFRWYRTSTQDDGPSDDEATSDGASRRPEPESPRPHVTRVVVDTTAARAASARRKDLESAAASATTTADAVWLARDLVNMSPVDLPPAVVADVARTMGAAGGFDVAVLDEHALREEGYGGLLAVGGGSARPPRLVVCDYRPKKASAHVALVGKGITFDSGGLSLKPPAAMPPMKADMAGAAAVLAATTAAARAGLPVRVTGYLALAENLPSGTAQRPSDVIRIKGGRTVEVLNTDAEGRLVLADALVTACASQPDAVVDVATLTGAAVVALGGRTSGFFSTDDDLADRIAAAARVAGEPTWRMPLARELRASLDSTVADIANVSGKREGGMIAAALFLQEFVRGTNGIRPPAWAHVDIAGPAFNEAGAEDVTPKGGTGIPVRTLVRLVESFA